MPDLAAVRPLGVPIIAIAAMMTTAKTIRAARNVNGSMYGRP
jgi:hypothetical protein